MGRKVTRVWEVEEVEGRLGGGGGRVMMKRAGWTTMGIVPSVGH